MNTKAIIERIRMVREKFAGERGKAILAKELGINPSTYNYYEKDRVPPVDILWKIAKITGTDLTWIIEGDSPSETHTPRISRHPIADKADSLLQELPQSAAALEAFLDLLQQKHQVESCPPTDASPRRGWLPVLGRTAAGFIHFWPEQENPWPDMTELKQLIQKHEKNPRRTLSSQAITHDPADSNRPAMQPNQVQLIQLQQVTDDGLCEFIDAPQIRTLYPDAFALRVDGDSMAPAILDGDILILSPSVPPRQGATAVVQLKNQIGVTCKLYRQDNDSVHLIPVNENYDPKIFPVHQLAWALAVLWRIRI